MRAEDNWRRKRMKRTCRGARSDYGLSRRRVFASAPQSVNLWLAMLATPIRFAIPARYGILTQMSRDAVGPVESLYVHVPFCAQKCSYCAFYSEASNGETVNAYVDALVAELELIADDCRPQTVFFGGGTPSLLNLRQWERILRAMERLDLLGAGEWTVECNPATVSLEKARLLREFGVNRVSMGVQSLDKDLLERLGRVHSREMVFRSFDLLRQAGYDNINIDLMFAIHGQTMEMWR